MSKGLIFPVDLDENTSVLPTFLPADILPKLKLNNQVLEPGQNRTFYQVIPDYQVLTIVNIHCQHLDPKKSQINKVNQHNEFIRNALGKAILEIKKSKIEWLDIADLDKFSKNGQIGSFLSEAFVDLAAEAGFLTTHAYKPQDQAKFPKFVSTFAADSASGLKGKIYGETQNFARLLMETPANLMTPEIFASTISEKVKEWNLENVELVVRDEKWIRDMKMGSFLSVSVGSDIPPVLLEIHVNRKRSMPAQKSAFRTKTQHGAS